jgi:hypothetical protein
MGLGSKAQLLAATAYHILSLAAFFLFLAQASVVGRRHQAHGMPECSELA